MSKDVSELEPQHGIWFQATRVLFPVVRPKNHKEISRAVKAVVARMKPRKSYCYCGKDCAVNRKYVAMLERQRNQNPSR